MGLDFRKKVSKSERKIKKSNVVRFSVMKI